MNELSHPVARLSGVALAAVIVFFLDTRTGSPLHLLVLPLGLAVAAWMMTRSLMAVAFATFTLAAINSEFGQSDWISSVAYPALAAVALVICVVIGVRRFRQRIAETHEARWAQRRTQSTSSSASALEPDPDLQEHNKP